MKYLVISIALLVAQLAFAQRKQIPVLENSALNAASKKNTEEEIDAIFNQAYPINAPGASVLIVKNDTVLYRKAFGMANLELNVQMKPDHVV